MKTGVQWLVNLFGRKGGRQVADAYRTAFSTPAGRIVLRDMAAYCNAGSSSFTPGDPHQTAFKEGARDAFLHMVELAGLNATDLMFFREADNDD